MFLDKGNLLGAFGGPGKELWCERKAIDRPAGGALKVLGRVRVALRNTCIYLYADTHIYMYTFIHIYIYIYTHLFAYFHIHIYMCICTNLSYTIDTYLGIYVYTHMQYIYIYVYANAPIYVLRESCRAIAHMRYIQ